MSYLGRRNPNPKAALIICLYINAKRRLVTGAFNCTFIVQGVRKLKFQLNVLRYVSQLVSLGNLCTSKPSAGWLWKSRLLCREYLRSLVNCRWGTHWVKYTLYGIQWQMSPVWNVPCQTRHNEGCTISEDLVMHIANNQRARTIHRSESLLVEITRRLNGNQRAWYS